MATSSSWAVPKNSLTSFYNTISRWSKLVMARVSCLSWHCQKYHTLSITVCKTLNVRVETKSGEGPLSIWCVRRKGWKDRKEKMRREAESTSFWWWDLVGEALVGTLSLSIPHKHPCSHRHVIWNSCQPPPAQPTANHSLSIFLGIYKTSQAWINEKWLSLFIHSNIHLFIFSITIDWVSTVDQVHWQIANKQLWSEQELSDFIKVLNLKNVWGNKPGHDDLPSSHISSWVPVSANWWINGELDKLMSEGKGKWRVMNRQIGRVE